MSDDKFSWPAGLAPGERSTRHKSLAEVLRRGTATQWLWRGRYFARGKLTLLVGEGGIGKTGFMLRVALDVARSGESVIFYTTEDDDDTIAARMLAMGVDLDEADRLPIFVASELGDRDWRSAALIVIDPIVEMLRERRSSNTAEDVRAMLNELLLDDEFRPAIVGMTHNVKRSYKDSDIDAVLGSGAWTQKCRVVVKVVEANPDDHDDTRCYVFKIKANATSKKGVLTFERRVSRVTFADGTTDDEEGSMYVEIVDEQPHATIDQVMPGPKTKEERLVEWVHKRGFQGVTSDELTVWFVRNGAKSPTTQSKLRKLLIREDVGFGEKKIVTYRVANVDTVDDASRSA